MIVKCRECGHDLSTEAAACPSCGCPQQPTPAVTESSAVTTKGRTHIYGWAALIAFLMSNFIPAIIAPLVVLVAFVLSLLEMNNGSKIFGGTMFALCALQGWYIADHFGNLRGSLGITNPGEIEQATVKKYSATDLIIPPDANRTIEQKCAEEWPSDFRMQRHCQQQQSEGIGTLRQGRPASVSQDAFVIIRGKCAEDWPRDFRMRAHCEGQQYEAYKALQSPTASKAQRGACAQQWPDDYRMRQHCESKR